MLMMLILEPHFENHWSRDMIMGGAWSEAQVKIFEGEEAKTWKNTYKTQKDDSSSVGGSDSEIGVKVFKNWEKDAVVCTGLKQAVLAGGVLWIELQCWGFLREYTEKMVPK